MTRSRRAGLSREEVRQQPLYARALGLQYLAPSGFLCFVFLEGAVALGVLLALAELVSWWGVLVLPLSVAAMVKLNDVVAGALTVSSATRSRSREVGGKTVRLPASVLSRAGRNAGAAPGDNKPTVDLTGRVPGATRQSRRRAAEPAEKADTGNDLAQADTQRLVSPVPAAVSDQFDSRSDRSFDSFPPLDAPNRFSTFVPPQESGKRELGSLTSQGPQPGLPEFGTQAVGGPELGLPEADRPELGTVGVGRPGRQWAEPLDDEQRARQSANRRYE
ncbi:hypothetical protein [Actinoplanes sp. TFC3]|uniref:hypothetical protein n=1 Tax=Actinoplanes sp. TFC3 TaxID=1710355 RepID=UPI000AE0AD6B